MSKLGKLYVVALPIGNPADMSVRAREVLTDCDVVAAEDTRVFQNFVRQAELPSKARVFAHHRHNEKDSTNGLIEFLEKGATVALVTDAGTPNVSDPGSPLVTACFEKNIPVIPIPGPSSLVTALSACPIPGTTFFFGGFPPAKKTERRKFFSNLHEGFGKLVFFEAPHRLQEHLADALEVFGDVRVFIARELTKKHEELLFDTIENAIKHFSEKEPLGEFVLVFEPRPKAMAQSLDLENEIQELLKKGYSPRNILDELLDSRPKTELPPKKELYNLILKIRNEN